MDEKIVEHQCTETGDKRSYRIIKTQGVDADIFGQESSVHFDEVFYFSDVENPGADIAKFDADGYGSIVVFRIKQDKAQAFLANVQGVFNALDSGQPYLDYEPHYPEDSGMAIYIKHEGDYLWAFVCDGMRSYNEYAVLMSNVAVLTDTALGNGKTRFNAEAVWVYGDENSDANFDSWLKDTSKGAYSAMCDLNWLKRPGKRLKIG